MIDERYVDRVAGRHNISLRIGCFCNRGAGDVAFTISRETLVGGEFGQGMTLDDYVRAIGLPSGGAIRVRFASRQTSPTCAGSNNLPPNSSTSGACPMTSRLATPADKRPTVGYSGRPR